MRRLSLVLFALLTGLLVGDHAVVAQNATDLCPPRYRRDPAATARAREAKKAQMRQRGFPERFLSLLDREECVACVETASDGFHIMVVYNDDENAPKDSKGRRWTSHSFGWDPQSERQVRDQLAAGKIKAFYIMNTATRCQCCPDILDDTKTAQSYSDWNADLEVNMTHVIVFDEPSDLGPLPADLENPPDGWINDVPDIEQFTKPPHRQVHVICQKCEGTAAKANSAMDTLDFLWDRKLTLLEGIEITTNAMRHRANAISRLEYQQLFSTRTDAREAEINALKDVNAKQQEGVDREERQLAEVNAQITEQTSRIAGLLKLIVECENSCTTATETTTPTTTVKPVPPTAPTPTALVPAPPSVPANPPGATCFGGDCGDEWKTCTESGTCTPVETDCGLPGACDPPCLSDGTCLDLTSEVAWTCDTCDADPGFQVKQVDAIDARNFPDLFDPARLPLSLVLPPLPPQDVRTWFNPLGLLARTLVEAMQRWRGSVGPAPLINPRDLETIEPFSRGQAAGLPTGVHLLLVDAGGSTGKTLSLQILNLSGKAVRLKSLPFAVEPIKQQAQQRVQQAFNRLAKAAPVRLELSAYCVELLKAPPRPNTILRLAPKAVQQKFAPMSKVLQSAYRVQHSGLLRPDSNPAAYTDSIKQWAVWSVEQKFNQTRFTDAFVTHTRKNIESAGQQWTRQAEEVIRKVSPNRWQDIVKVLAGAGMQVSQ